PSGVHQGNSSFGCRALSHTGAGPLRWTLSGGRESVRVHAIVNARRAPPRHGGRRPPQRGHSLGERSPRRVADQPAVEEPLRGVRLLQGDGGASLFELCLRLLSGLLVGALKHRARRAVNEGLRLTEAEAGEGAHLLDDLNLLVTGGFEDDVE